MTAHPTRKTFPAAGRLRGRALSLLAVLGLVGALTGRGPEAAPKRPIGPRGVPATVTLSNGSGEGRATVTLDAYGAFGSAIEAPLLFQPPGETAPSETVFESVVWYSGAGAAGQGNKGAFLDDTSVQGGVFTDVQADRATSEFTLDGMLWVLTQVLETSATGTTLRQEYSIANNRGQATSFDLIRYFDGDLQFDGSEEDFAAVTPNGQTLFEFDSADDPSNPSTFIGIDLEGDANLGYQIAAFELENSGLDFKSQMFTNGRSVLKKTITDTQGRDADKNDDRRTDFAYDLTLNLGRTLSIPSGQTLKFVTRTFLGAGAPSDIQRTPTDLEATAVGPTEIDLKWFDNSQGEQGFHVERRDDGPVIGTGTQPKGSGGFTRIGDSAANVKTFQDKTVQPSHAYTYRVQAFFSGGKVTPYSNEASAATPEAGFTAPSNLTADLTGPTAVHLAWQDNSDQEEQFVIERRAGNESTPMLFTVPANTTSFDDTDGLALDTRYHYVVYAQQGTRKSGLSNQANVLTFPAAPSGLSAEATLPTAIHLSWTNNSGTATRIGIFRQNSPKGGFEFLASVDADRTSFDDDSVSPKSTRAYKVRAVNASGSSAFSNEASATTPRRNNPPAFESPTPEDNAQIAAQFGQQVTFTVRVSDPDTKDGDTVTLSVAPGQGLDALPSEVSFSPGLPATGNPVSTTFSWTPTAAGGAQVGTNRFVFTARDAGGNEITRTIQVNIESASVCAAGTIRTKSTKLKFNAAAGWPQGKKALTGTVLVEYDTIRQHLKSSKITDVIIRGKRATVTGKATINGRSGHTFKLVVEDHPGAKNDRLLQLIVDGKNWPNAPVSDLDVHYHPWLD